MKKANLGKILKKIESVLDTTGIYPQSVVGGKKPYKKRNDLLTLRTYLRMTDKELVQYFLKNTSHMSFADMCVELINHCSHCKGIMMKYVDKFYRDGHYK